MEPRFLGSNRHSENDLCSRSAPTRLRPGEPAERQLVVLSSLGQDLRDARQRQGLELSQISSKLKISKRHLNALEESNVGALPRGDVYLVGYTRSYAGYLGLNTGQCLEKLKSEIAERDAKCQVPIARHLPQKHKLPSVIRYTLGFLGL